MRCLVLATRGASGELEGRLVVVGIGMFSLLCTSLVAMRGGVGILLLLDDIMALSAVLYMRHFGSRIRWTAAKSSPTCTYRLMVQSTCKYMYPIQQSIPLIPPLTFDSRRVFWDVAAALSAL